MTPKSRVQGKAEPLELHSLAGPGGVSGRASHPHPKTPTPSSFPRCSIRTESRVPRCPQVGAEALSPTGRGGGSSSDPRSGCGRGPRGKAPPAPSTALTGAGSRLPGGAGGSGSHQVGAASAGTVGRPRASGRGAVQALGALTRAQTPSAAGPGPGVWSGQTHLSVHADTSRL